MKKYKIKLKKVVLVISHYEKKGIDDIFIMSFVYFSV